MLDPAVGLSRRKPRRNHLSFLQLCRATDRPAFVQRNAVSPLQQQGRVEQMQALVKHIEPVSFGGQTDLQA